ncbi:LLM class F420-dependent oxidoreductase [Rhizohabitans arisaemae]|uniref:LLM class F420-dependent oxidoreductase n=1 Tax=Rhizohabitans arisaemae TaxID=2720610 RepID=UPI0024B235F2|nr:LLM class F420-dependent oxidoreductase [Rhizohabitans arisaemae]
MAQKPDLGTIGVWSALLRGPDRDRIRDVTAFLDELGYGTLWTPGGTGGDLFGDVDAMLAASSRAVIATGVLNIWMHDAAETAAWYADANARHPGRLLLGLGSSHASRIEAVGRTYDKPLTALREYLDALDAAPSPVPAEHRVLAALGPKALALAGERSAGVHPYLVDSTHTHTARQVLGPDPLLAPELKVVLDTDRARVRATAGPHLAVYLGLPNYTRNLLRSGFTEGDFADGGSDRLLDRLVAWGDVDAIVARAQEHIDAGADHVCIQVVTADWTEIPRTTWAELAPALLEGVTPRTTPTP